MTNNLNWTEIFKKHPELSPPGYEEAAERTKVNLENKKQVLAAKRAVKQAETKKKGRKK